MKQSTKSPTRLIAIFINKSILSIMLTICCCACVVEAQEQQQQEDTTTPKYHVTILSSLGGNRSIGNSINNRGWVSGYSNLPDNQSRHAMLWRHGFALDLGTLGGLNSNVAWPVKSNNGILVGISQTSKPQPRGEEWSCSSFFPLATRYGYTCLGFVWENGKMSPLPTLGGDNGFAASVNDRGQIVGWAENKVVDDKCVDKQVLQFKAVVWNARNKHIKELPILHNDSSSAATAINNKGQIVGISGVCDQAVGRDTARHAVLWERDGSIVDIGNLGEKWWNTPTAINEKGDIVGFAGMPGSDRVNPILHAFMWTKFNGISDLGTLNGDIASQATGINKHGQVVGVSSKADNSARAFIWENGVMEDLNQLIPKNFNGILEIAGDINDYGEITGRAYLNDTKERVTFVAIPVKTRR